MDLKLGRRGTLKRVADFSESLPQVAERGGSESDWKTKIFPIMNLASDVGDQFSEKPRFGMGSFFFLDLFVRWCGRKKKKEWKRDRWDFLRCRSKKWIEDTRESFRALILCRKPKSNDNGKYKRDWERKEWRLGFSRGSAMWVYVHRM